MYTLGVDSECCLQHCVTSFMIIFCTQPYGENVWVKILACHIYLNCSYIHIIIIEQKTLNKEEKHLQCRPNANAVQTCSSISSDRRFQHQFVTLPFSAFHKALFYFKVCIEVRDMMGHLHIQPSLLGDEQDRTERAETGLC